MKRIKITSTLLICCLGFSLLAQVNGNGKMKTITIENTAIRQLSIDFPVSLVLDNTQEAGLTITADENVFQHIGLGQNGQKLNITQEKWIRPSRTVQVRGSLPQLEALKMGGYGKTVIHHFQGTKLDLDIPVGEIQISGTVEMLKIRTKTGTLDASALNADRVDAQVSSFGKIIVQAKISLDARAKMGGVVLYSGLEQNISKLEEDEGRVLALNKYQADDLPEVNYITVKLQNKQTQKIDTYVQGPKQKRFSYGIPFKAGQVRTEEWPVGTKLYQVNAAGMRKLIYTLNASDANQTLTLD